MAVYDKSGKVIIQPIEKKPKGGKSPRRSGDRVEKIVARELGEQRTIGSGAFKQSNKNLTGDIDIRDNEGKAFVKLEVKYSGTVTTKGEKCYSLTTGVLDQMEKEAHEAGELGALILQFKRGKRYAIISWDDFHKIIELAKLGQTIQKGK